MQEELRGKINAGNLDGYLVIPADLSQSVKLHTKNPGNFSMFGPITSAVNEAVVEARLRAHGIHVDNVRDLVKSADLQVIKVTKQGESVEKGQTIGIAIALVILLYMSLLMYGIITMRSVLEEKTTRTMEVLISAVTPSQLLAGKILGVAGVAVTQFLIWGATVVLLGSYGVAMAAMGGAGSLMSNIHVPASLMICAVIYFFCGYFLYASMFAAVGAACSSEQDAQQLQWIAMAPLVFTMLIYSMVLNDSTSRLSVILSEVPFFRAGADAAASVAADTAALADRIVHRHLAALDRHRHFRLRKNLPRRHPDVREAPHAAGTAPLAAIFVEKSGGQWPVWQGRPSPRICASHYGCPLSVLRSLGRELRCRVCHLVAAIRGATQRKPRG